MSPAGLQNRYVVVAIQPARSRGSEHLADDQILLEIFGNFPELFGPRFELLLASLQALLKLFLFFLTQLRHIDISCDEFTHCSPLCSREVDSLSNDRNAGVSLNMKRYNKP